MQTQVHAPQPKPSQLHGNAHPAPEREKPEVKRGAHPHDLPPMRPGQIAVGKVTFLKGEGTPTDVTATSDNPAVATMTLDPDLVTWRIKAIAEGTCHCSYSGTRSAPNFGSVVAKPIKVTVVAPIAEETAHLNAHAAHISGP